MNRATIQLILEARDLATPALTRLRDATRQAERDSLRAAKGMTTLGRATNSLAPASEAMERMRHAFMGLGSKSDPAGSGLERIRSVFGELAGKGAPGMLRAMAEHATALPRAAVAASRAFDQLRGVSPLPPEKYAAGGRVFRRLASPHITIGGGHEDDVPAMLMRGEFVLRKEAVRKYGLGFLQALNGMRLPEVPLTVTPRFAAGGLVLPPHLVDMLPRFASGGLATTGIPEADALLRNNHVRSTSQIASRHGSMVQSVVQKLQLPQLRNAPAQYLSQVIGAATKGLQVFENTTTPPQEKADGLLGAAAELAQSKDLMNQDFVQRINAAKQEGNEELAAMLEMQRLELESLVDELRMMLEEIADEYVAEVQNTAIKAASNIEEMRANIQKLRDEMASQQLVRGHMGGSYNARGAEGTAQYLRRQAIVNAMNGASGSGYYGNYGVRNQYTIEMTRLEKLVRAEERRAGVMIRSLERKLDRESSRAVRQTEREGINTERSGRLEMRKYYLETLHRIQELEIDWNKSLNDLNTQYGSADITGFRHWLATGGPVGFAKGGQVPRTPGSIPGRDSVPALLMPGEFVLRKEAVQNLGLDALEKLNSLDAALSQTLGPALHRPGATRHFATGGLVAGQSVSRSLAPQPGGADFGSITLNIGGGAHTLWAERQVARSLRKGLTQLAKGTL